MSNSIIPTIRIISHLLRRDFIANGERFKSYMINYWLIYPALYTFLYRYLQATVLFPEDAQYWGAILYIGSMLLVILVVTYRIVVDILFDLEGDKFVNYQITLLSPTVLLCERIFFAALFAIIMVFPFYPFSCLLSGNINALYDVSWIASMGVIILSCLMVAAYQQMAVLLLNDSQNVSFLWARINNPLLAFGGLQMPLYIMRGFDQKLGLLAQCNPFMYVTEGLRQAMVGGKQFLSVEWCIIVLSIFSIAFISFAAILFKKRIDHI